MHDTIRLSAEDARHLALMAESLAAQSRGIQKQLRILDGLMACARLMEPSAALPDIAAINTRLLVENLHSGEMSEIELAPPEEANPAAQRLSVLSPVGSALLGRSVGECVVAETDEGCLQLRIHAVIDQPQKMLL